MTSDLLGRLDPAHIDLAYARHRAAQLAELHDREADSTELSGLAVDGKASRGTAHGGNRALHRLGAFTHSDAIMVATCKVDGKPNEINAFAPLLYQIADLPATMRSYAISALRLLGFTNIAEATRWARDDFTHPKTALDLTM